MFTFVWYNRRFSRVPTWIIVFAWLVGALFVFATAYVAFFYTMVHIELSGDKASRLSVMALRLASWTIIPAVTVIALSYLATFAIDPKRDAMFSVILFQGVATILFTIVFSIVNFSIDSIIPIFGWVYAGVASFFGWGFAMDRFYKYQPPEDNSWKTGRTSGHL